MKPPKLLTAEAVTAEFMNTPKLLDSWLMIGYRQWYKRKFEMVAHSSKERHLDQQLKGMDNAKYRELKQKVRNAIGKK